MTLFVVERNVELSDGTKADLWRLTDAGKIQFEHYNERIEWLITKVLKLEQRVYELELPAKKAKLYSQLPDEPHTLVWLRNRIPDLDYQVLSSLEKDGLITRGRMIQKVAQK